jgi:UDP-glucose 4-epimerase
MHVLTTGGAGYIGSHVVLALQESGYSVVVLDNLSTGNRQMIPADIPFVKGDVGDRELTEQIIERYGIDAVIHLAGSIVVPESVRNPLEYYRNNTCASRNLIASCVSKGVRHIVFSSTAAVYGNPAVIPITEDTPTMPMNPYGASKLMTEWILRDTAAAHDLTYVSLRYFNVAGADPLRRAGQSTRVATHLLKVACEAVVGRREYIQIFGTDYDTPDGTCIRDYIHVSDLADAHVRAVEYLASGGENISLNCGYGRGHSVLEVLSEVQSNAGTRLDLRRTSRRPGDPPALVADVTKLRQTLLWTPRLDDLPAIVRTALDWERQLAS